MEDLMAVNYNQDMLLFVNLSIVDLVNMYTA